MSAEMTIAYRIEERTAGHVTIGLFAGRRDRTRAKAGQLVFAAEDWPEVEIILSAHFEDAAR